MVSVITEKIGNLFLESAERVSQWMGEKDKDDFFLKSLIFVLMFFISFLLIKFFLS